MSIKNVGTTVLVFCFSAYVFAGDFGPGNGGDFHEPDLYSTIEQIETTLDRVEKEASLLGQYGYDVPFLYMGKLTSETLQKNIGGGNLYIRITEKNILDRNGASRSAINFPPGKIRNSEIKRYRLPKSVPGMSVIIVNRGRYLKAILLGKSFTELMAHELLGIVGENDFDYSYSRNFVYNQSRVDEYTWSLSMGKRGGQSAFETMDVLRNDKIFKTLGECLFWAQGLHKRLLSNLNAQEEIVTLTSREEIGEVISIKTPIEACQDRHFFYWGEPSREIRR